MLYARILINNSEEEIEKIIDNLKLEKKSNFSFYDLVYINKNGKSITDDTLKIRVYNLNEWDSQDVLVIRKKAILTNGAKEDKVLLKEEFDTLEEAEKFVLEKFSNEFKFAFKLSKTGKEYASSTCRVWIEDIENYGKSIEIGSDKQDNIDKLISNFSVVERLQKSIPEVMYEKYLQEFK